MSEHCPYYLIPGSTSRHIAIGSDRCLAQKHPMCGFQDICPGGIAEKAPEPEASALEPDDGVSWADLASEIAEPAEAEAVATDAEPPDGPKKPAPGENLAEALHQLRSEKGLTQKALGQAAGLSLTNISKWESGQHRPGPDSLMKLDRIFGSDLAERFGSLDDHKSVAAASKKSQPAEAQAVPPTPQRNHNAKQASVPVEPIRISPGLNPGHDRDDFLREILREAARTREEFNAIIHAALEVVRGLDLK